MAMLLAMCGNTAVCGIAVVCGNAACCVVMLLAVW